VNLLCAALGGGLRRAHAARCFIGKIKGDVRDGRRCLGRLGFGLAHDQSALAALMFGAAAHQAKAQRRDRSEHDGQGAQTQHQRTGAIGACAGVAP
jgi:hypothetical protein